MASTLEALLLARVGYLYQNTPQQITSVTLGSPAANQPFTIPTTSGFNRVQVFWWARATASTTAEPLWLRMNGDSAAHYLWQTNQANNATPGAGNSGAAVAQIQIGTISAATATAGYFSSGNFVVEGIAGLTNMVTVSGVGAAFTSTTNSYVGTFSGQYLTTGSPISSLTLLPSAGDNFATGCVFSAYGLV